MCKEKKKLRSRKMADGIGRISGGGSGYGVNWNNNRANNGEVDKKEAQEQKQAPVQQNKTLNPDEVLQFLTNNNYFMPASVDETSETSQTRTVDPDMAERVANSIEVYELVYSEMVDLFGEEAAPGKMDELMDKLLGMF